MTLTVTQAELACYPIGSLETDESAETAAEHLANNDPALRLRHLNTFDLTRHALDWQDDAQATLLAPDSESSTILETLTDGDLVVPTLTAIPRASSGSGANRFGQGRLGKAAYGGLRPPLGVDGGWVGVLIDDPHVDTSGQGLNTVALDLADFVYATLNARRVYRTFREVQICTGDPDGDGILETILRRNAPEIDRSQLTAITGETTIEFDGTSLMDAVAELAARSRTIHYSDGAALRMHPLGAVSRGFAITPADYHTIDRQTTTDPVNDIRLDGGVGTKLDEAQETVVGFTRVSDTSRLTYELSPQKYRIDRFDIYTRLVDGSDDSLRVRVQPPNDTGSGPLRPSDDTADIISRESGDVLADDDWRRDFNMRRDEPLPPNPWLIIDSTGQDGVDVGVDDNNAPAFRSYYPYPIVVRETDDESIAEYGRRTDRVKRDNFSDFADARDHLDALLADQAWKSLGVTFDPRLNRALGYGQTRAYEIAPGDVHPLAVDALDIDDEFVCIEHAAKYDATSNAVEIRVNMQDVGTVL